jgi:trimeric autotransporter adhesin
MSTKTTFKRVALVAVAALGLGMVSAMPSTAAAAVPTAITVGTIPTAQVGVVNTTPVTVTFPKGLASDTFSINVRVTSAPAGSQFRSLTSNLVAGVAATGNTIAAKLTISQSSTATGLLATATGTALTDSVTVSNTYTSSTATAAAGSASFNINMTPDVAGSYTILVSTHDETSNVIINSGAGNPYTAGDAVATYTVSTGATASTVALAAVTGAGVAGSSNGMIFKATIKDAAGNNAQLGLNETITFAMTSGAGTTTIQGVSATSYATKIGNATATFVATSANFTNGVGYFIFKNSAAETAVITATGSALLGASVLGTLSVTTRTDAAATGVTFANSTAQGLAITAGTGGRTAISGTTTATQSVSRAAASHSYVVSYATAATLGTTTLYENVAVTDTSGRITGIVGAQYNTAVSIYASDTTDATTSAVGNRSAISITATLATAGNSFAITVGDATLTVTSAAPAVTAITASPANTIRQTHGASSALTVKVTDQFGAAVALEALTVATTGRNASTSSTALVTDASGLASFTRADAGTAATVLTTDTVTFTSGSVPTVTRAVTINYGVDAVSKIACTSGAELDTATSVTYRDISSADGAEAGAASLCTVTVTDVNGAILVGVPVTVTTTSAGAAVLSTSATLYTGALGTVAPSVYAWTAGAKTFTVTAGTVTSTETINFRQETAAEVRSISVVADGNRHLVTAKDRFGNVVPGVRIYGTRTGNGLFGGGTPTANAITANPSVVDANTGVAEFIFNSGSADSVVKYQVASAADTPSATFGYTSALKGSSDDGTTALTASVAGTTLVAEKGVGASFDAAGVNSVTAAIAAGADTAQNAVDAAAEATDAANAATDAANAAAEAADAATAAAQDAADAVAALSTQVSEMVSALKKQITALTNLVIKIQKKVRA